MISRVTFSILFLQFCSCHCWLVSIQEEVEHNVFVHLCSGAHKTKFQILTAAHCFNNKMNRLDRLRVTWNGVTQWFMEIDYVLVGRNWETNEVKFTDDIAWVFLKTSPKFTNYQTDLMQPAPRNFTMLPNYSNCSLYGWPSGIRKKKTGNKLFGPAVITKANLVSDDRCIESYGPYQEKKVCVENLDPKVECPNDRSTLLICYDLIIDQEYLTGISMRGPNYCGRPGAPALFEYLKYRTFVKS